MTADKLLEMMKSPEEQARPYGKCVRYVWSWSLNGEPCTRAVNTLLKRKKVSAMYFKDNRAGLNIV